MCRYCPPVSRLAGARLPSVVPPGRALMRERNGTKPRLVSLAGGRRQYSMSVVWVEQKHSAVWRTFASAASIFLRATDSKRHDWDACQLPGRLKTRLWLFLASFALICNLRLSVSRFESVWFEWRIGSNRKFLKGGRSCLPSVRLW